MLPLAYKILIASSTSKQLSAFSPHPGGRKYAANHIKIDAAICHIKVDVDVILAWFNGMFGRALAPLKMVLTLAPLKE